MFLLQNEEEEAKNETTEEPAAKKIKLTGRNKKRPKRKKIKAGDKICPAIARDQICSYGNKCKFSHDKAKFIADKLPDIGDQCYVFETYGKCPFGLSCRFGSKHITEDFKNIVKEDFNQEKMYSSVKNVLKKDNQVLLWKRKYNFSKANVVIDKMGCRNPKEKQGGRNSDKDSNQSSKPDIAESNNAVNSEGQGEKDITQENNVRVSCDTDSVPKTSDRIEAGQGCAVEDEPNISNAAEANLTKTISAESDMKMKDADKTTNNNDFERSSVNSIQIASHSERTGQSEGANVEIKSSPDGATSLNNNAVDLTGPEMKVDEGMIRLRPMEKKKVCF